jgi:hypothetical protein
MDKPSTKTITIENVLDYTEAAEYINSILGYDQRDAAGKFSGSEVWDPKVEYLDYWHYVMDAQFDNFSNDSFVRYGPYSFVRFAEQTRMNFGEDNWRSKIAEVWAREYPDEYEIWMCW